VIQALTEKKAGSSHVPFRDSVLTRILQQSIGGNCKTALIVCASPADADVTETLSTLRFASRAKRVRNVAKVWRRAPPTPPHARGNAHLAVGRRRLDPR
jgi:kinesin family protein 5